MAAYVAPAGPCTACSGWLTPAVTARHWAGYRAVAEAYALEDSAYAAWVANGYGAAEGPLWAAYTAAAAARRDAMARTHGL
jgi:hypothetical protein